MHTAVPRKNTAVPAPMSPVLGESLVDEPPDFAVVVVLFAVVVEVVDEDVLVVSEAVVVSVAFETMTSSIAVVVTAVVVISVDWLLCLEMFSRPKPAITFSDGVIGFMTKKRRITIVNPTNIPHDITVILVDFFNLLK